MDSSSSSPKLDELCTKVLAYINSELNKHTTLRDKLLMMTGGI
jgi:hypothetical protein